MIQCCVKLPASVLHTECLEHSTKNWDGIHSRAMETHHLIWKMDVGTTETAICFLFQCQTLNHKKTLLYYRGFLTQHLSFGGVMTNSHGGSDVAVPHRYNDVHLYLFSGDTTTQFLHKDEAWDLFPTSCHCPKRVQSWCIEYNTCPSFWICLNQGEIVPRNESLNPTRGGICA